MKPSVPISILGERSEHLSDLLSSSFSANILTPGRPRLTVFKYYFYQSRNLPVWNSTMFLLPISIFGCVLYWSCGTYLSHVSDVSFLCCSWFDVGDFPSTGFQPAVMPKKSVRPSLGKQIKRQHLNQFISSNWPSVKEIKCCMLVNREIILLNKK